MGDCGILDDDWPRHSCEEHAVCAHMSLVIVDFDRVPHAVNPEYSTFDVLHDYSIVTYLL